MELTSVFGIFMLISLLFIRECAPAPLNNEKLSWKQKKKETSSNFYNNPVTRQRPCVATRNKPFNSKLTLSLERGQKEEAAATPQNVKLNDSREAILQATTKGRWIIRSSLFCKNFFFQPPKCRSFIYLSDNLWLASDRTIILTPSKSRKRSLRDPFFLLGVNY